MLLRRACFSMPPDVPEIPAGPFEAALFAAMQARDPATGRHCNRVVALSVALARACGLPEKEMDVVSTAARLHDVGKIGTPDRVLHSPHRLDPEDWEIMKAHAATGAAIIMQTAMPHREAIALAVRHHHEHFDGSGYPDGLAGHAIGLHARIISVADSYDALGDARPYHPARSHAQIMRILNQESGSKCDPDLLRVFETMIRESRLRVP